MQQQQEQQPALRDGRRRSSGFLEALGLWRNKQPQRGSQSPVQVVPSQQVVVEEVKERVLKIEGEERELLSRMVGSEMGAAVVIAVAREYASLVDPSIQKYGDLEGIFGIELCGKQIPKVSLAGYLCRLIEMLNSVYGQSNDLANTGFLCLMIGTIYIDRILKSHKELKLHAFNIHRVFFVAIMMAAKFSEDQGLGLTLCAKMGGVDVNQVELQEKYDHFCHPLKIRFVVQEPSWIRQ